ncbi:hypothetical protein [Afipia clevelandensis]|uniref:Uncharacterized protein n=1 Tax=Afipia clevelandensis ATCC 49720 TaxID=883079 RepID=K8P5G9_9BRAD|nr:hypothetical protein [Afipia clevelandensis]EKS37802.1 hypothetical protein HMPREF9696_01752 [Afipia clevelandensis ATCC 49720]
MADHNEIRDREKKENDTALIQARSQNKPITFIAHDGCEVTVTPDGRVFYNMSDWY